jgi:5-(aminomethyl)-3-furanmethanol phosphate kinase
MTGVSMAPVVVKLGGSFAFSEVLTHWIAALASCAGSVVIVPGGGPFADAVRHAQGRMGFDDRAAHEMSLLAMEQYGRALISFDDLLSPADTIEVMKRRLAARQVPVWMPMRMVSAAADIAPSWTVTSDSLAAWLCSRIGSDRLILVKHADVSSGPARCEDLVSMGLVDEAFPSYLQRGSISASILGPGEHAAAVAAIRCGAPAGVSIK